MFTNQEIFEIAMKQSAEELNCDISDFRKGENVVTAKKIGAFARKYYKEPIPCNIVSYGSNIVASVEEEYRQEVTTYLSKFEFFHCFETPNLHWLNERLCKKGVKACFMAEYWLPDMSKLKATDCGYTTRVLEQTDFQTLYLPEWSNALCESRKELDVLGVGAYDGDKLIGLAGCSADCDTMWQIGVDVLPAYRRKGIASTLTSLLALETLKRGKVPFYCCAWSNVRSARNAIKSGFVPAWVELTIKSEGYVNELNGENNTK